MGLLVGGILGRLGMLLLRLTSPESVIGLESDDGFEIGVVSFATVNLFGAAAAAGAINGVSYAAVRGWLGTSWRVPAWTVVSTAILATAIIRDEGVDFNLLQPVDLAVAIAIVVPALLTFGTAWLTDRWVVIPPFATRRVTGIRVVLASFGTVAVAPAVIVAATAIVGRRLGLASTLRPVARVAAPIALAALALIAGRALYRDILAVT